MISFENDIQCEMCRTERVDQTSPARTHINESLGPFFSLNLCDYHSARDDAVDMGMKLLSELHNAEVAND